jgi:heme A synthase
MAMYAWSSAGLPEGRMNSRVVAAAVTVVAAAGVLVVVVAVPLAVPATVALAAEDVALLVSRADDAV